ncbi:MAG: ABC transporter permease [Cytophagales bacterium]|nr:MAG: ABC transporter permease [Cytophagales bacterium]
MNTAFFIAKRYLFSKKKKNFINIISTISVGGVAVGTMALVIVMAVFNGLQDFTMNLYASHNPEIRIVAKEGKSFEVNDSLLSKIRQIEGVKILTEVIEDNAFVNYGENQMAVNVKGVSDNFVEQYQIGEGQLMSGKLLVKKNETAYALIGVGVQVQLGVVVQDDMKPLMFLYPRKQKKISLDMNSAIIRKAILPSGVLNIDQYFNNSNVLVPIEFAEELMLYGSRRTSLEVKTNNLALVGKVQQALEILLGSQFSIKNREEQQESILRATRIERLFVFITFALILGIASINIFFSLAMLAIEKQKDIAILFSMGASRQLVKKIFLMEGSLIAFIGTFIGLVGGLALCFVQQEFEIIPLSQMQAYPVKVVWTDLIYVVLTITVITFMASYAPARTAAKINMSEQL